MVLEIFMWLLKNYGYFGLFLANLIATSTIIIPLPVFIVVFGAGAFLNPFLVGLASALGAAIGELTGYGLGWGGKKIIEKKWKKWIKRTEKMFCKYGGFWVIILFAVTPLPDDIVGIVGGTLGYPLKKFFIASFIGKLILNLALAYGGFYGLHWVLRYFGFGT